MQSAEFAQEVLKVNQVFLALQYIYSFILQMAIQSEFVQTAYYLLLYFYTEISHWNPINFYGSLLTV